MGPSCFIGGRMRARPRQRQVRGPKGRSVLLLSPDEVRSAILLQSYDLDVHLIPAQSQIAVHARLVVTNVGAKPLAQIALQVSGPLGWESFAIQNGEQLTSAPFVQHLLDTDTDHTGQAQGSFIVTLPAPLQPGASIPPGCGTVLGPDCSVG